ncbi:hypothetical protein, partial [Thalassolituus sp. UBA6592]|uniref:hypothetical protein n=2 Tax=unclassified Thalassolituus TaxID=2624967 RepID=UPI0025F07D89
SQKARSGEVARPASGAVRRFGSPLYEDKGPDIFRKCLNRNLWDSNGTDALFICLKIRAFYLSELFICLKRRACICLNFLFARKIHHKAEHTTADTNSCSSLLRFAAAENLLFLRICYFCGLATSEGK